MNIEIQLQTSLAVFAPDYCKSVTGLSVTCT